LLWFSRADVVKLGGAVLVQGAGAVFCAGVSFALTLWLARVLGTAGFGAYVALLSLATLALMLQEGGWPAWLYRERARADAGLCNGVSRVIMARFLVHVGAVSLVLGVGAWWWSGWDLAMALLAMACVALMNGVSAGLRGAAEFGRDAAWQSWGRVVSAGAVAGVLGWGSVSLAAVFGAWAAGLAMVLLAGGWWWHQQAQPGQGAVVVWPVVPVWAGWRVYRQDLVRVWPFAFMAAAGAWLLRGDVVVLAWWGPVPVDAVALSWYAACTRLLEAALLMFAPVANVLLRSFSDDLRAGRALALRGRVARWCLLVGGLGALAVALAWAVGPGLMALLFGTPYAEAGQVLPWVLTMLPFALANLVMGPWLAALGRERGLALGMLLAGALLLLALLWGVPVWGLQGAAVAVAVSHAALLVWGWWLGGRSA
jgi:O-antigen/teichoic acid export membrane protein